MLTWIIAGLAAWIITSVIVAGAIARAIRIADREDYR